MPKEFLVCGKSIREGRRGSSVQVIHFLGEDLKMYTSLFREGYDEPVAHSVGQVQLIEDEDLQYMRLERPWILENKMTEDSFEGPIRGHVISYNKRFGLQAWVYVPFRFPDMEMLIRVSTGEVSRRDAKLHTQEKIQRQWVRSFRELTEEFLMGMIIRVQRNARTRKFEYVCSYDDDSPISDVGAEGGGELPESAPR